MSERMGVAIGIASCSAGAGAAVATRYLVGSVDPIAVAAIRFGGGFLCLLPLALLSRAPWPRRGDWAFVGVLGFLFYAVFFVLYNVALQFTTVARGTLALATLPLATMLLGSVLGRERLGVRKSLGVAVATAGVAVALGRDLDLAPAGAWQGDIIMVAATLCMAVYSIYSRPYVGRSSPLGFLTAGMGAGALALVAVSLARGGASAFDGFGAVEWLAAAYLAAGGGALAFFLWVYALRFASPTQVTNTMSVNPLVATILAAALLGEPITIGAAIGLAAIFFGIWLSTTGAAAARRAG